MRLKLDPSLDWSVTCYPVNDDFFLVILEWVHPSLIHVNDTQRTSVVVNLNPGVQINFWTSLQKGKKHLSIIISSENYLGSDYDLIVV